MRRIIPIIILFATLTSCREPMSTETFIPGNGPFRFKVDMTDSLAVYDFDFYTRVDAAPEECPDSLELKIRWVSPQEEEFREIVYLPLHSGGVYEPYRADSVPSVSGEWTLIVATPSAEAVKGFRGLGLVTKKRHGTR